VIATANNRDKGVNELSSALKRRFNTVILPVPATLEEEVEIVQQRVSSFSKNMELPMEKPITEEINRVVTIFRELRSGLSMDGKNKLKSPSGTLSTAEAISVMNNGLALAYHFGDGHIKADDIASILLGAVVKDPVQDKIVWQEYLETIVKQRDGWKDIYRSCRDML
jgi:MoxR-like ATPase